MTQPSKHSAVYMLAAIFLAACISSATAQNTEWSVTKALATSVARDDIVIKGEHGNKTIRLACNSISRLLASQYYDVSEASSSTTLDRLGFTNEKFVLIFLSYHGNKKEDYHAQMALGGVRLYRGGGGLIAMSETAAGDSSRINSFLRAVLTSHEPLKRLIVALIDARTNKLVVRTQFNWGDYMRFGRNELRSAMMPCLSPGARPKQAVQNRCDAHNTERGCVRARCYWSSNACYISP